MEGAYTILGSSLARFGLSDEAYDLLRDYSYRPLAVSPSWIKIFNFLAAGLRGRPISITLRKAIAQCITGAGFLTGDWNTTAFTKTITGVAAGEALVHCIKSSSESPITSHVAEELTAKLWLIWACIVTFDKDTIPDQINSDWGRRMWQEFVIQVFQYNWPEELIYPDGSSDKSGEATPTSSSGAESDTTNQLLDKHMHAHTMVLRQRKQDSDHVARGKQGLKDRAEKEVRAISNDIVTELDRHSDFPAPALASRTGTSAQAIVRYHLHTLNQRLRTVIDEHYAAAPE